MRRLLLALLMIFPGRAMGEAEKKLKKAGWVIHSPDEFHKLKYKVMADLTANRDKYILDSTWMLHQGKFSAVSYDRADTPENIMFGDLIVVREAGGEVVELRWYDGKKHIVYNKKHIKGPVINKPRVGNCLF